MKKKQIIGIVVFMLLVVIIVVMKFTTGPEQTDNDDVRGLTTVYVATGGGKEDFLADKEIQKILKNKYKLNVIFDTWSNGKTITSPLIRETVGLGNQDVVNRISNGETFTIKSEGVTKYDALFTSDQRFYDYYKTPANKENGEADRYTVKKGSLTLNTQIGRAHV